MREFLWLRDAFVILFRDTVVVPESTSDCGQNNEFGFIDTQGVDMKRLNVMSIAAAVLLVAMSPTQASEVGFGELYYEGQIVGTVVPPASSPREGRDNLYAVPDQLSVIGVAPGDRNYHGGHWAFHSVTWNVAPYLLTSEADVLAAAMAGDVTITRLPSMDFRCPVLP